MLTESMLIHRTPGVDASPPSMPTGTTAKFGTGAVRSSDAEGTRFDLVSPIAMRELCSFAGSTSESYDTDLQAFAAIKAIYEFLGGKHFGTLRYAVESIVGAYLGRYTWLNEECLATAMQLVAEACHEGAEKYSDFNWEKGMPVHDLLNHAIRHLKQFLLKDTSEPHLGHALWNVFAAMHSLELWPELNAGHLREAGCKPPAAKPPVRSTACEVRGAKETRDFPHRVELLLELDDKRSKPLHLASVTPDYLRLEAPLKHHLGPVPATLSIVVNGVPHRKRVKLTHHHVQGDTLLGVEDEAA